MFTSFGEIILTLVYITIFLFVINRAVFFSDSLIHKSWFYIGFAIKLLAGFALTWIYTYYYTDRLTADIYKYFDDSKIMFDTLGENPGHFFAMLTGIGDHQPVIQSYYDQMLNWHKMDLIYNDNAILIRFNSVIRFFSLGYFAVHTIVMVFISYAGIVGLFHLFKDKLDCKPIITFFAVLLLPSVLFWTSGVLKDALLIGLFGLFLYHLYSIKVKGLSLSRLIITGILVVLLIQLKLYVFLIALPGVVLWFLINNSPIKISKSIPVWVGTYFIIAFVALNFQYVAPKYNIPQMLAVKQYHFNRLAQEVDSGSFIQLKTLNPTFKSIVFNSPSAFFTVLVRPHIFESKSVLTIIAALENLLIILLILFALLNFNKKKILKADGLFLFSCFMVLFIFILIGLVTPVLGAIVRYKAIALPFLIFAILYGINFHKREFLQPFAKNKL